MSNLADIRSSVWGFSIAGFGVIAEGLAAIRQNIEVILKTTKGTDPLRPFFGSDIYTYIDKPVTRSIPNMKNAMLEAVEEWEPRVKIVSIEHVSKISSIEFSINYVLIDKGLMDTLIVSLQDNQIVTGSNQTNTLILQGIIPQNPTNQRDLIGFQINGNAVKPIIPVDGFETVNELYAFILNYWGTYGKWSLLTDRIICYLNVPNIKTVSLTISLSTAYTYRWFMPVISPLEIYLLHFNANDKDIAGLVEETRTPGQVIAALNNEWGMYGNWSLSPVYNGYTITLVSNTTKKAFLDITAAALGDFNNDFNNDYFDFANAGFGDFNNDFNKDLY